MAQRKAPRRTRERILETSLALFNRDGEPHVTTADIADEMNISPGNLYYHFRNKDEIVGHLYTSFEGKLKPLFDTAPPRAAGVEDLWLVLHLLFEQMWEYRFLFRDLDEIVSRSRRVGARFAELIRRGETTVVELCRGLAHAGTLNATEREIAALAKNAVLVSMYWMSFERIGERRADGPSDVAAGMPRLDRAAYQVLSLIAPYLVGDDRALIEHLGREYLQED
jgi:AcrR family transcriptional regulator